MTGTDLKDRALQAFGPHESPQAVEILLRADVALLPAVQLWTSSEGSVTGRSVVVAVDAYTLGALHAAPHVAEAVQRAIAHALSAQVGEALANFSWAWSRAQGGSGGGYRGAVRHREDSVAQSIAARCDGAGDAKAAALVRAGSAVELGDEIEITTARAPSPHDRGVLAGAVRDLFGAATRVVWRTG